MSRRRKLLGLVVAAGMLSACDTYVPKGSTVVAVKNSKREFDRADLRPPANELQASRMIPMKWYDTNTFITSGTLSPGIYSFRARNFDGGGIVRDIVVVADKSLYEIDAASPQDGENESPSNQPGGIVVKGRIALDGKRAARNATVLFIGPEIVMRTVPIAANGSFSVDAPRAGRWKIEVHLLGLTPLSYVKPVTEIAGPVDLGLINPQ